MTGIQPASISRAAPPDLGLDYSALLAQGIALVQELTNAIWTNYNYSDPGVTLLEQLCYALTELAYRANFPVQDLLGERGTGQIDLRRQGLYPARTIMPVNPVTVNDLRRLIIDRVPEVSNAWFTPVPASQTAGVSGLYRIAVLLPPKGCECDGECRCECACHGENDEEHEKHRLNEEAAVKQVLKRYRAHRALCEDVQACDILRAMPTRVRADVHLDDHSDPDAVLAQLLFALGLALTPEPKRTSLNEQIAAGHTTADIFNGPLMLRGFITDDQLMPLPRQMSIESLLELMVGVPGVLSVDHLSVHVHGSTHAQHPGDVIDIPQGHILTLVSQSSASGFTLRLLYDGVVCIPNPQRVKRLLERAWAAQRRVYPLWAEYGEVYRPPAGQGADLSAYTSVQNQFPAIYGIGDYGLPSDAGPTRHAQAKQLKGYLMPFDQLMADYFSQLAFVRDLFSIQAGGDKTYAWQSLRGIVPNVAPLLQPGYDARMAALTASNDPVVARQSAVLDFLLSLYAESLALPRPTVGDAHSRCVQRAQRLKAKQALLTRMVPATRDRGRGFDYASANPTRGMAGLEIRCRIELALLDDGALGGGGGKLYLVEWVLLRDGIPDQDQSELSFRVSAVMAAHDDVEPHHGWRRQARGIVRDNMPAHVLVQDVFLGPRRMRHFVRLYEAWVQALQHGTATQRARASHRLARFLRPPLSAPTPVTPVVSDVPDVVPTPSPPLTASISTSTSMPADAVATVPTLPETVPAVNQASHPETSASVETAKPEPEVATPEGSTQPTEPSLVLAPTDNVPRKKWWQFWRRTPSAQSTAGTTPTEPTAPGLPGLVQAAPPRSKGIDTDTKLTADTAQAFATDGFDFVVRYLTRNASESANDLSTSEAMDILQAGLALMAVQHSPAAGYSPTASLGTQYGQHAAANARAVGLPSGVSIWMDLEGVAENTLSSNVIDYCNAWYVCVLQAGYVPGLYVGAGSILTSDELYSKLRFQRYWQSGSSVPDVSERGYCMVQTISSSYVLDGVAYDLNFVQADNLGDTPFWLKNVSHSTQSTGGTR